MPTKKSAAKRYRQNEKHRVRNRAERSRILTARRRFMGAIEGNDKAAAEKEFYNVAGLIDSAVNKGLYHRNTADRKKSRLHKKLNAMTKAE